MRILIVFACTNMSSAFYIILVNDKNTNAVVSVVGYYGTHDEAVQISNNFTHDTVTITEVTAEEFDIQSKLEYHTQYLEPQPNPQQPNEKSCIML